MSEPHNLFKARWCTEAGAAFRVVLVFVFACVLGCTRGTTEPKTITLATTTSTQDSGLLDQLLPHFRQQTGIEVKVVAVGSGQALELGRRGDADVLLTHAPAAEEKFVAEGYAAERRPVMHNDFVLAGPKDDPASIQGKNSAAEAFQQIAKAPSLFVSRADESGTHQKEREVWTKAGVDPKGSWYIRAGTGMTQALRMASEKQAYVVTDRATFLALRKELDLVVLVEDDDVLLNRYAVIVVSPKKHPHVRHEEAQRFAEFLLSSEGQQKIDAFGKEKYGEPLFFPDAGAK
jgi:tungstate transport system substrate-binding protein